MTEKLETCRKAIEKFGITAQVGMMHEEMCELGVALEHWKRDRCKKEDVVTEIADVMIVAAQMAIYFGKEAVDAEIDRKLERLEGRMKGESEDERIRKFIAETVFRYYGDSQEYLDVLAYLEKQKEQKPSIPEDIAAAYQMGLAKGRNERKPVMIQWTGKNLKEVIDFTGKSPKFGEWFKLWEDFENYVHSHDEILKLFREDGSHYEVPVGAWIVKTPDGYNTPSRFRFIQKPAEWSEEDEEICRIIINRLTKFDEWASKQGYTRDDPSLQRDPKEWLKSLCPMPKREWGEEDKRLLRTTLECLNYISCQSKTPVVNWLNSLPERFNLQPKQEWSEEDKTTIDCAVEVVEKAGLPSLAASLKSLRPQPHWKPSDEQLRPLEYAIDYFKMKRNDTTYLESLYNDLKKLM